MMQVVHTIVTYGYRSSVEGCWSVIVLDLRES
jgi:hypothetical protein